MSTPRSMPGPKSRGGGRALVPIVLGVLVVIGIPILEWTVLALVVGWIGFWPTVAILAAKMIAGAVLARRELARARDTITGALAARPGQVAAVDTSGMGNRALVLVGAILLILPGLVTDLIGLVLVVPPTRAVVRRAGAAVFRSRAERAGADLTRLKMQMDREGTIPGETDDAGPGSTSASTDDSAHRPRRRPGDDGQVISGEIVS